MRQYTYRSYHTTYRRKWALTILVSEDPQMVKALDDAQTFRYMQETANAIDAHHLYGQCQRLYFLALRHVMPADMACRLLDECIDNGETLRYNLYNMAKGII